jgi:hypothetical protein
MTSAPVEDAPWRVLDFPSLYPPRVAAIGFRSAPASLRTPGATPDTDGIISPEEEEWCLNNPAAAAGAAAVEPRRPLSPGGSGGLQSYLSEGDIAYAFGYASDITHTCRHHISAPNPGAGASPFPSIWLRPPSPSSGLRDHTVRVADPELLRELAARFPPDKGPAVFARRTAHPPPRGSPFEAAVVAITSG